MTTLSERYADLMGAEDDPALVRLVGHLDQALREREAPPELHKALERLLRQRLESQPALVQFPSRTLSRRDALKAGAASMAFLLTLSHIGPGVAEELAHLAQDGPMTGARLAGILRSERSQWTALLARIGPEGMEEPGVEGAWSVKELVAHLTWYERVIVEGAQQVMGTGRYTRPQTELRALAMDERNARIAADARSRPVSDILAEAEQVFGQLVTVIAAAPQDILNDPHLLGLPDDIVPWMAVANNSYAHYRQHEQAIRAWLNGGKRPGKES